MLGFMPLASSVYNMPCEHIVGSIAKRFQDEHTWMTNSILHHKLKDASHSFWGKAKTVGKMELGAWTMKNQAISPTVFSQPFTSIRILLISTRVRLIALVLGYPNKSLYINLPMPIDYIPSSCSDLQVTWRRLPAMQALQSLQGGQGKAVTRHDTTRHDTTRHDTSHHTWTIRGGDMFWHVLAQLSLVLCIVFPLWTCVMTPFDTCFSVMMTCFDTTPVSWKTNFKNEQACQTVSFRVKVHIGPPKSVSKRVMGVFRV